MLVIVVICLFLVVLIRLLIFILTELLGHGLIAVDLAVCAGDGNFGIFALLSSFVLKLSELSISVFHQVFQPAYIHLKMLLWTLLLLIIIIFRL